MSNDTKTVNIKDSILNEQKEIAVKTFFGHEIKVRSGGSYEVLTGGIKGLIDKIIWFFFAPTLRSRQAAVEKSLKDNNSQILNEKNKSNNVGEQGSLKTITTSDDLNKTNQSLSEKNTKMANNSYDSNFQLLSNEKDSIGNQTNINNDNRNNSSIKERESENVDNEFSVFKNENNNINSGEWKNSIKGSNVISSKGAILNDAENLIKENELKSRNDLLNFLREKGINPDNLPDNDTIKLTELLDLVDANNENKLTKEELASIKKNEEEAAFEKEKAEEGFIEKMSNIIPKGYRVTSSKTGDKIEGDGNCFYRAIAKLEKKDQEKYGDVRNEIYNKIVDYCNLLGQNQTEEIDDKLILLIQQDTNEYKMEHDNDRNSQIAVLFQIGEFVRNENGGNIYGGLIEAYFYAKKANKVVIIYDSNGYVSGYDPINKCFIDKDYINNKGSLKNEYIANVVKLAYNAVGRHYEAIVPMNVKN